MSVEHQDKIEVKILKGQKSLASRMQNELAIIEHENPQNSVKIERFPTLISDDEKRVRFNPFTGVIYIASFREGQPLPTSEGSIKVINKRYSSYPDIETAIRGVGHIIDKNKRVDGQEVENTKKVVVLMRNLISDFRSGKINKDNIGDFADKTAKTIEEAGLLGADKNIKQQLKDQLSLATQPDRLGRFNPLISRTRLASAFLKTTRELLFAKLVREKYSYFYAKLSSERDMERFYLEQAVKSIDDILGQGLKNKEYESYLWALVEYGKRYFTPEEIKVNPYRGSALAVNALLSGIRKEGREERMLKFYFKDEANEILAARPIHQILRDVNLSQEDKRQQVLGRLANAREKLSNALKDGSEALKK